MITMGMMRYEGCPFTVTMFLTSYV